MAGKIEARFIDPMLLLKTEKLPESQDLIYELDGYRAIARDFGYYIDASRCCSRSVGLPRDQGDTACHL